MAAKIKNIFERIGDIMAEMNAIEKKDINQHQRYKFRGIDTVMNGLHSHFAKHGVFVSPKVTQSVREERKSSKGGLLIYTILTIEFTFYAVDGSSFTVTTVGEGMDSGDKSCNKAMSAALKYALTQMLLIPTEEQKDAEQASPQPVGKKTLKDSAVTAAAIRVSNGETELVAKIKEEYTLSASQEIELQDALNKVKKNAA